MMVAAPEAYIATSSLGKQLCHWRTLSAQPTEFCRC